MTKNQAKKFLENEENYQALKLLTKRIQEVDRATGEYPRRDRERLMELNARRRAIDLVSLWITDLFAVSRGEWDEIVEDRVEEDEDLTRYYDQ